MDCTALKRALEIVYAATLPKASKPFIYMSIILPPEHVDVNVHPTKREVYAVSLVFGIYFILLLSVILTKEDFPCYFCSSLVRMP